VFVAWRIAAGIAIGFMLWRGLLPADGEPPSPAVTPVTIAR
jgi:hypothetical protein